jgi:hypothetical protein
MSPASEFLPNRVKVRYADVWIRKPKRAGISNFANRCNPISGGRRKEERGKRKEEGVILLF